MESTGATVYDFMKRVLQQLQSDPNQIPTSSDGAAIAWAVDKIVRYAAQLLRAHAAAEIDGMNFIHCDLHFGSVDALCGANARISRSVLLILESRGYSSRMEQSAAEEGLHVFSHRNTSMEGR